LIKMRATLCNEAVMVLIESRFFFGKNR